MSDNKQKPPEPKPAPPKPDPRPTPPKPNTNIAIKGTFPKKDQGSNNGEEK